MTFSYRHNVPTGRKRFGFTRARIDFMHVHLLRRLLPPTCLLFIGIAASAQQKEIFLWPNGAPGSEGKTGNEKIRIYKGEQIISKIHRPSITLYLPAKAKLTSFHHALN